MRVGAQVGFDTITQTETVSSGVTLNTMIRDRRKPRKAGVMLAGITGHTHPRSRQLMIKLELERLSRTFSASI